MEDERFYRYGRFYSFNISLGKTTFTGNRGGAYRDQDPALGLSLTYFMNFQNAFGIGIAYSKHSLLINQKTITFNVPGGPGLVDVNYFRSYFFYRYYIDTADLGTAITYSNPYFTGQLNYWNQTNKFIDRTDYPNKSDGALGFALGAGMEFPIALKETYFGAELLFHLVNFRDTYSPDYRPVEDTGEGYSDLKGTPITIFLSYVINW